MACPNFALILVRPHGTASHRKTSTISPAARVAVRAERFVRRERETPNVIRDNADESLFGSSSMSCEYVNRTCEWDPGSGSRAFSYCESRVRMDLHVIYEYVRLDSECLRDILYVFSRVDPTPFVGTVRAASGYVLLLARGPPQLRSPRLNLRFRFGCAPEPDDRSVLRTP